MAYLAYREHPQNYLADLHGRPIVETTDTQREFVSTSDGQTFLIIGGGIYQVDANVKSCPSALNARPLNSAEEGVFKIALGYSFRGQTDADRHYVCREAGDRERWDSWIGQEYPALFKQYDQ